MTNILDLTHTEAQKFLLKNESYFSFDLPQYFNFNKLLESISQQLEGKDLIDCYLPYKKGNKKKFKMPKKFENVNYNLLHNKNGEYSWRLFQLIHPVLYVALVHKITEKDHWETIKGKLNEFKLESNVECLSLPVLKSENQKSDKAEQILMWWEKVEQESVILSLEYDYIFHTDIVDCYGSIYTHLIPQALHTKKKAKKQWENTDLIGIVIDNHLRSMANGQTNGIPQGSVLMDFIAEIVLGHIDQELTQNINNISKNEYKIIRYRDDYRIFVNNPEIGNIIIKELTNTLSKFGMRLSSEKTKYSDNVIPSSIKSDKLYWIKNNKSPWRLQDYILIIRDLAEKHPNSGTLIKVLQNFYEKIEKIEKIEDFKQNTLVLISILIDIAFKNPRTYPISSAILSKLISFLDTDSAKMEVINKIRIKFKKLPNTEHLDLWLQRITLKIDKEKKYQSILSQKVNNNDIDIWNSDWLQEGFKKILSSVEIIDKEIIKNMDFIVSSEEVALFEQKNKYY